MVIIQYRYETDYCGGVSQEGQFMECQTSRLEILNPELPVRSAATDSRSERFQLGTRLGSTRQSGG